MEKLVHSQTPAEYFRELVEDAVARQKLTTTELSSYYLVNLLDTFVRLDRVYADSGVEGDRPLAELLCHAMTAEGRRQLTLFKLTGDLSLFMSGFFSDSLRRRLVDLDYYVRMGGYAYGRASRLSEHDTAAAVFMELSQKFVRFVDVLNEVSEASSLASNRSLLRLYEKWLTTGSHRSAELLRKRGVVLNQDSKQVH